MISKVVGYQGFQSYGDLPYAALKPGRKTLDSNDVWEKTTREEDKMSFYHNSNFNQTVKQNTVDQTVRPEHYKNVELVAKGTNGFTKSGYRQLLAQTGAKTMERSSTSDKVRTGVEHWQTNYQASIADPINGTRGQRAEWTYPKPPHQVFSKVGPSEYKKTMGDLGSNPRDILQTLNETQPRTFDELRLGTTQNSQHPPGYTGFIPQIITASKAVEHGQGTQPRHDFMKTNLRENYHTKIPGYAGHVPRSVVNQR